MHSQSRRGGNCFAQRRFAKGSLCCCGATTEKRQMAGSDFPTREKQPCKLPLRRRFALFMVAPIDPATNTARVVCQVPMIVVHQGGKNGKKLNEKMAEKKWSRVA